MNFFQHQDTARRNTKILVVLMAAAVFGLIAMTSLLIFALGFGFQFTSEHQVTAFDHSMGIFDLAIQTMNWQVFAVVSVGVIIVVSLGSLYKLMQLRGGGRTVAEAMGGRLLNINTRDRDENKVLNVVEEMAIASGTPVPPVYLIDDSSINAFAAGFNSQDAVIGVTRGCIQLLNRDELQGVIAHEFSHILHGDMRLNIRLVGILHGILLIGLIGYFLIRTVGYRSLSRNKKGNNVAAMLGLAIGLIVIGYAGTFFGNIIKAAVSRQREFLADASAVQFTRNPEGISGALKKLGGYSQGSLLQSPRAAEFSHMYFGQGVVTHLSSLMATHPPLPERIKRIDPSWSGGFPDTASTASTTSQDNRSSAFAGDAGTSHSEHATSSPATDTAHDSGIRQAPTISETIESIGAPTEQHVQYAQDLLASIPKPIHDAAHEPFSARALVYAMLLEKSSSEVQKQQWQSLRQHAHPVVFKLTQSMANSVQALQRESLLPLVDLCIPTLKCLSRPQYQIFKRNIIELIRADNRVDLFEWSLYRILIHNLDAGIEGQKNTTAKLLQISQLTLECQQLLSLLSLAGCQNPHDAETAFSSAMKELELMHLPMLPAKTIQLPVLDSALDKLRRLKPLQKPQLLKAIANCIYADQVVTVEEAELFRAIADSLDCPVPPIWANKS